MLTLIRRARSRVAKLRAVRRPDARRHMADQFLTPEATAAAGSPNGHVWFHAMPVPDGRVIAGVNADLHRERKLWDACFGPDRDCLAGRRVLDVGANDGFFTIAALLCGAASAHAVNTGDLSSGSYPANLKWASHVWAVRPKVTVGDFLALPADGPRYDVILFFGVLYHLENVYAAVRLLGRLLAPGGTIYLETQTTRVASDRPVLELATDDAGSTVPQVRAGLGSVGNSNYLLPNPAAVAALADTFDLAARPLPMDTAYGADHGGVGRRRVFALTHKADGE
jgi:2-polyprenyl-3-methyl-5-hydroxy-6-metoxy-1,4-benzoquinol methylase